MKIPKKVKVGGIIYDVAIIEDAPGITGSRGEIDYAKAVISIKRVPENVMLQVLWHEIVHAIFDTHGIEEHNEENVDRLAHSLHALVVDNPEMFDKAPEKKAAVRKGKNK